MTMKLLMKTLFATLDQECPVVNLY